MKYRLKKPAFVLLALFATTALCFSPAKNQYKLRPVFGKDFQAFEKALGVKFKQTVELVPDMVPGKSYTDAETASLPKIKSFMWKAKVRSLGDVSLGRTEKKAFVVDAQFVFAKGSVRSWKVALQRIGIASGSVTATPTSHKGAKLSIRLKSGIWDGYFYPVNPDTDNNPWLEISVPN